MEDHDYLVEEVERLRLEVQRLEEELARNRGLPPALSGASPTVQKAWTLLEVARVRGDRPHGIVINSRAGSGDFDGRVFIIGTTAAQLVERGLCIWHRHGESPEGVPHGLYLTDR